MISIDLINYNPIKKWRPMHGDMLHFNGWFTRWIGVVAGASGNSLKVIRAGTVAELCNYGSKAQEKNTINLDVEEILSSNAKYSVNRVENNVSIWYL